MLRSVGVPADKIPRGTGILARAKHTVGVPADDSEIGRRLMSPLYKRSPPTRAIEADAGRLRLHRNGFSRDSAKFRLAPHE
ncbi:MAG: hypothetical protein RMK45_00600 [Armatimonadota bacterium]|nr:hypothetical protein [Armatimonadota bacterium]